MASGEKAETALAEAAVHKPITDGQCHEDWAEEEPGGSSSKAMLGKRSRVVASGADGEQTSSVHSLMQACATAFAGMRTPIKQMVRICMRVHVFITCQIRSEMQKTP